MGFTRHLKETRDAIKNGTDRDLEIPKTWVYPSPEEIAERERIDNLCDYYDIPLPSPDGRMMNEYEEIAYSYIVRKQPVPDKLAQKLLKAKLDRINEEYKQSLK